MQNDFQTDFRADLQTGEPFSNRKIRMLLSLRGAGISDVATLRAMELVPRQEFAPPILRDQSYEMRTLPIDCGQTLSAPDVVAMMTQSLQLSQDMRILEVGTGSGYQAAVLANIVARVFTIERWQHLSQTAANRLAGLSIRNILCAHGDGYLGWPSEAPFDGILIAAGCEKVPDALFAQLADGARLVAPVGKRGEQYLVNYQRQGNNIVSKVLAPVSFVPLLEGTEQL